MSITKNNTYYRFQAYSSGEYLNIYTDGAVKNNTTVTTFKLNSSDNCQIWKSVESVSYTHLDVYKRQAQGDVEIYGIFKGNIESKGNVKTYTDVEGDIIAGDVEILQKALKGNVTASGKVKIADGSPINGNVNPVSYTHLDVYKRQSISRVKIGIVK